jgi:hypothetical protein
VRQLRDATTELIGEVFSVRFLQRCYKLDKSRVQFVMRQSPARKGVNTEAEEAAVLEAVTSRQPAEIQLTEKA